MIFQQIRGATAKITYKGTTFLIDPFFADKDAFPPLDVSRHPDRRWPTVPLPLAPEEIIRGIGAVIVTHLHPDHFDEAAIRVLPKTLPIFAQDETDADVIRQHGFSDVRILAPEGISFGEVTLWRIAALHGYPETTQKYYDMAHLRETACGAVFKADGEPVFYLAGDTIWYDKVAEAIGKFQPSVITLNAAEAQFTDSGPIIMGTDDVLQVCWAAPQARIILTHLDAVPHAEIGRAEARAFVRANGLEKQIFIPEDGESLILA